MKQTKLYLRLLLMAIVMMAMSSGKAWAQDEECEHEYYYVQLLGGGSHYQKCDKCNGYTDTEYCTYEDGICMYCGFECQHPEYESGEESHTCRYCSFKESHEWNEGKCDICGYECYHPEVEQNAFDCHKCKTCGVSADHEWNDMGHCFTCTYVCQHEDDKGESTWNDGVCSNCGYECEHHWAQIEENYDFHHCTICEQIEEHDWSSNRDGVCTVCEYKCPHGNILYDFNVPTSVDYEVLKYYYNSNEFLPETVFCPYCCTCNKSIHLEDEDVSSYRIGYSVETEPECIFDGNYKCFVEVLFTSGYDFTIEDSGSINSLGGHTPVTDEAVDATCTESGRTEGSHCEVCKEVLVYQVEIPALGHEFSYEQILCADGYHRFVCTRVGCDLQSEEKYAKMFGEYREVTGNANPTATIQLTQVGNKYYTSLYTDFPYTLDWTNNNTSTWTVLDAADGVVTLGDINDVPANCGVIIIKYADESSVAECTIEYAPYIYSYDEPDASPLLTGSETDVTSPADNQYAFGLSDTGYLGFWHWSGMTIPAWKAYLDLGSETATEARGFRIVFDDETNGIHQLPADASAIEGCYDLMGRKVREVKGLGIVNGKKVFVNY